MDLKDKEYLIRVSEFDGLDYDNIVFTQNDTNNCRLNIEMFEEVDELLITFVKNDGTQVVDNVTHIGGTKYTYDLPISTINVVGNHKGYLTAYGCDFDRRTLGMFRYKITADVNLENIATDTEYPILTKLINDVNNVVTNENERVANENIRISNENVRVNEFDSIKKDFDDLKKVTIDSNVAVNLQNQINVTNTSLDNISNSVTIDELGIYPNDNSQTKQLGSFNNPFKDIFIGNYSRMSNGYTKLPNGMMMQWGVIDATAWVDGIVYFPIAFPNMVITINPQIVNSPNQWGGNLSIQGNDRINFRLIYHNKPNPPGVVCWLAIGY